MYATWPKVHRHTSSILYRQEERERYSLSRLTSCFQRCLGNILNRLHVSNVCSKSATRCKATTPRVHVTESSTTTVQSPARQSAPTPCAPRHAIHGHTRCQFYCCSFRCPYSSGPCIVPACVQGFYRLYGKPTLFQVHTTWYFIHVRAENTSTILYRALISTGTTTTVLYFTSRGSPISLHSRSRSRCLWTPFFIQWQVLSVRGGVGGQAAALWSIS